MVASPRRRSIDLVRDAAKSQLDLGSGIPPRPRGKVRPLAEHERKLLAKGPIEGSFPLKFESGLVIEEFMGKCRLCSSTIPLRDLRGTVGWHSPDRVVINAIGACRGCRVATSFVLRVNEDGDFSTLIGHCWRAGSFKASTIQRLQRAFSRWCRRVVGGA